MTAAMKNCLDWASKHPKNMWQGKAAAIVGAGGGSGTARAQLALRQCGVFLDITFVNSPEVNSVPVPTGATQSRAALRCCGLQVAIQRFREACFDERGELHSEAWSERVRDMLQRLLKLSHQMASPAEVASPSTGGADISEAKRQRAGPQ